MGIFFHRMITKDCSLYAKLGQEMFVRTDYAEGFVGFVHNLNARSDVYAVSASQSVTRSLLS